MTKQIKNLLCSVLAGVGVGLFVDTAFVQIKIDAPTATGIGMVVAVILALILKD